MKLGLFKGLCRFDYIKETGNEPLNILSLRGLVGITLVEQPCESRADIVNVSFVIDNAVDGSSSEFDCFDI